MDTQLADWIKDTPDGKAADAILRKCVHCGFCTATCPTYQILGDELDSPRGRIYLIKQVLEGKQVTRKTQQHLDRCLTCRNCETTCPSGVKYGQLIDIGRKIVDERVERPMAEKLTRESLKMLMTNRPMFTAGMAVGKAVRGILPESIKKKVPAKRTTLPFASTAHTRKVILLKGCVQPAMMPSIDSATSVILDALGIQSMVVQESGCCGAVKFHLNDHEGGLTQMKTNIDAWYSLLQSGEAEALVMNASGCGVTVREYAQHFESDPEYATKAKVVSEKTLDIGEFITQQNADALARLGTKVTAAIEQQRIPGSIAFHPPCTLQHGQQIKGVIENVLTTLGFKLTPVADSHLCCGSAGTYSVLQPELSKELKRRKLANLMAGKPQAIASANIGCLGHLESDATVDVRHWVEWVAQAV
ncbi:MAG: glycolate oxidase subunit GlcF [Gammaproteobacteria bacterium]|nr:glycolate oxidase subunit GlcF [Gammaproteobacteria bacterium]MBU0848736.1 glycolate oxidase subunit GlcF [Gammaproteobacteria bacterium]MBU1779053.1 glycolate oxidase subunit GlcF [Gammaproteobacteria bacterium]MBU2087744.1 glycolate oxidase subunit GlcF [Gammaproteobacteria bacterium]MBU2129516.1 glycolate oxidase subunit GlcF [Gammaproteobacteria bacterium]